MKLKELEEHLEAELQGALFVDYCPNGLQVEGKEEVRKVATAVSASLSTIEKAVEAGCDALVVHHGLFWNGDSPLVRGTKRKKLKLLLEKGISLFAYHLPLDAHPTLGNNWKAALDWGWQELQPFGKIGVKGVFAPMKIAEFVEMLERYYGQKGVVALGGKEVVRSGALISGGAYKEVWGASKAGVDLFITGNYDEPAWWGAHEEGIHFLALGHTATEKVGVKALAAHLIEKGLDAFFIEDHNPF